MTKDQGQRTKDKGPAFFIPAGVKLPESPRTTNAPISPDSQKLQDPTPIVPASSAQSKQHRRPRTEQQSQPVGWPPPAVQNCDQQKGDAPGRGSGVPISKLAVNRPARPSQPKRQFCNLKARPQTRRSASAPSELHGEPQRVKATPGWPKFLNLRGAQRNRDHIPVWHREQHSAARDSRSEPDPADLSLLPFLAS